MDKATNASMMPKLEWEELFSTSIDYFDDQHKKLFDIVNELRGQMLGRGDKEVIEHVLTGLFEYTMTHFLEEEIALLRLDYPAFFDHKAEHDQFLLAVRDLYVRFKAGKSANKIIAAQIIAVVSEWLQGHILVKDKAYGEYLRSHGFTPEIIK